MFEKIAAVSLFAGIAFTGCSDNSAQRFDSCSNELEKAIAGSVPIAYIQNATTNILDGKPFTYDYDGTPITLTAVIGDDGQPRILLNNTVEVYPDENDARLHAIINEDALDGCLNNALEG